MKKFADENANIQRGIVAAERMFEVLNLKPANRRQQEAPSSCTGFNDKIEFENVWFRYEGRMDLQRRQFHSQKRGDRRDRRPHRRRQIDHRPALPRLFEVQKGEIRIDGKPFNAYTQKSIREQIAFVSQKPFLFFDTVAANIAFGRNFSKESIQSAAKARPCGRVHQPPAQDNTTRCSPKMARTSPAASSSAWRLPARSSKKPPSSSSMRRPPLSTSISEMHIKNAIASLHGEVTQILIAHRLSTIEHADKIIYLDRGVKLAEGNRDELLKTCDPFRRMWEALYHHDTYVHEEIPEEKPAAVEPSPVV